MITVNIITTIITTTTITTTIILNFNDGALVSVAFPRSDKTTAHRGKVPLLPADVSLFSVNQGFCPRGLGVIR
jgi:hypothetical protein